MEVSVELSCSGESNPNLLHAWANMCLSGKRLNHWASQTDAMFVCVCVPHTASANRLYKCDVYTIYK